jgi:hypothetical protein
MPIFFFFHFPLPPPSPFCSSGRRGKFASQSSSQGYLVRKSAAQQKRGKVKGVRGDVRRVREGKIFAYKNLPVFLGLIEIFTSR